MDLKQKDVAELLTVSLDTIDRWVREGSIPTYQWEGENRFNRQEIENWIVKRFSQEKENFPFGENRDVIISPWQQFGLYRAIHRGDVLENLSKGTKERVIEETIDSLKNKLHFDAEVVTSLFLERESLMPTALCHGVAIPHTREFLLDGLFDAVCVVFLEEPLEWGSFDHEKVHTLFFVFACDDKRHLNLLAKIAHFCSEEENLQFLRSRPSKATLLEEIKQFEASVRRVALSC
jgi:PTS system nitrogen regulatory IIA component